MVIFDAKNPGDAFNVDESKYVLFAYRGSHAHNLYVPPTDPNSIDDVDYIGICYGHPRCYLGGKEFGSRGTVEFKKGRLDLVTYEVRKAVSLLLNGNPNIISILWNKDNMYQFESEEGEELIEKRDIFSSKKVGVAFSGYAYGQLQKMETRDPDELRLYMAVTNEMKFRGIHPNCAGEKIEFNRVSGEDKDVANWDSDKLKAKHSHYVRKGENLGYLGDKRKSLVLANGYDTKNAAHCIRLLRMGKEFMLTGQLNVYRVSDREELLNIKKGGLSLSEVKQLAAEEFAQFEEARKKSTLPDEPDYEAAWSWCERSLRKYLNLGENN